MAKKEKPTGHCDLCGKIVDEFVDGRLMNSMWANACLSCWEENRMFPMLGIGMGQRYKWMLCPYRQKWDTIRWKAVRSQDWRKNLDNDSLPCSDPPMKVRTLEVGRQNDSYEVCGE